MSRIALVAEPHLAAVWSNVLGREGHAVEVAHDSLAFGEVFEQGPFDILIVDVAHPDCGEGMLIPQVHATWPACKILATVSNYRFRQSAVFEMGLWKPDQVLVKPLSPRLLCATVSFLWAQARTEQIRRETFKLYNRNARRAGTPAAAVAAEESGAASLARPRSAAEPSGA